MSLSPQGLRDVPVVRRRQRSRPAALHHPRPERVNPDASRFYCGPGNVGHAPHADGGRDGCVDSAGRRRARSPVASSWSTRQCNSAGRDRNGHRSAPGPGSGHTRTSGPRPASAIPANAEDEADVRLDGCAMAAILRATQSAVCRSRRLLVDWVQARLRLHFAGYDGAAPVVSSATLPIRRGGALRNPGTAPRPASATSRRGETPSSAIRKEIASRSISPPARCRQIYAVLESHRQLAGQSQAS